MKAIPSRILVGLLAAAGLFGASVNAQAATTTSNFTVTINLTAACQITFPTANVALNYTAFSASAVTGESPFTVQCSQGLPYTPSLAMTTGTLVGVNYTLDLGLNYSLKVTPSSGAGQGNDGQQSVNIGLTVPGGQPGNCASGSCTASTTHTLVLTY